MRTEQRIVLICVYVPGSKTSQRVFICENNKGLITLMTVFKDAPIDQHSRNWPVFISAKSFRKTILIRHLKHHQPAQHVQPNQVGVLFFLNVALLELCERLFCLAGHVVDEEKK